MTQFAHASAIELVTPQGKLAQYYMGVEFSPKDLRLGIVEASHGTVGSLVDDILTYCYRYDPGQNRHTLVYIRIIQAGGFLTVLALGCVYGGEFPARHSGGAGTENNFGERIKGRRCSISSVRYFGSF